MDAAHDLSTGATLSDDDLYWNQPEDRRAELINGTLYDMTPPARMHQGIVTELAYLLKKYIHENDGLCKVYVAPFAVRLNLERTDWVEPDVIVVCDPAKLSDRGCEGAPDLVVEIVSPSSQRRDYITKTALYERSGVREYWIVDPAAGHTMVYRFSSDSAVPDTYAMDDPVPVGIWEKGPGTPCSVRFSDYL